MPFTYFAEYIKYLVSSDIRPSDNCQHYCKGFLLRPLRFQEFPSSWSKYSFVEWRTVFGGEARSKGVCKRCDEKTPTRGSQNVCLNISWPPRRRRRKKPSVLNLQIKPLALSVNRDIFLKASSSFRM